MLPVNVTNLSIQQSEMHVVKIHYKKEILNLSINFPLQSPQYHFEIHSLSSLQVALHFLLPTVFYIFFTIKLATFCGAIRYLLQLARCLSGNTHGHFF